MTATYTRRKEKTGTVTRRLRKHTALGDARWAARIFDRVMGSA